MGSTKESQRRVGPLLMALLAVVLAGTAMVGVLRRGEPPAPAPADDPADPGPRLSSTRVVGRSRGNREFELRAGSIVDEGEWVRLEAIEDGVLYRDGEPQVTFAARSGRWHRASNDLVLTGHVVLVYDGRVELVSERLEWRAADDLVVSPGPVDVTTGSELISAGAMEADLDAERVRFYSGVRIERSAGGWAEVPEMMYWLEDGRLEGYGPGRAVFIRSGP
ncbi:MAG: LPS export ABC transporter periplasmic protein LptC [Firmicutes bacterium]|nr:LPS export ABC transporter periplasmic protein LptC [Bacillota bacterium]